MVVGRHNLSRLSALGSTLAAGRFDRIRQQGFTRGRDAGRHGRRCGGAGGRGGSAALGGKPTAHAPRMSPMGGRCQRGARAQRQRNRLQPRRPLHGKPRHSPCSAATSCVEGAMIVTVIRSSPRHSLSNGNSGRRAVQADRQDAAIAHVSERRDVAAALHTRLWAAAGGGVSDHAHGAQRRPPCCAFLGLSMRRPEAACDAHPRPGRAQHKR